MTLILLLWEKLVFGLDIVIVHNASLSYMTYFIHLLTKFINHFVDKMNHFRRALKKIVETWNKNKPKVPSFKFFLLTLHYKRLRWRNR